MSVNIEQSTTDEALVRQSLLDKEAFAYLIDRYETRLHRYIARFGRFTKEDIDDVLQNTFIKVYENLHGFDTTLYFRRGYIV
jgi:DNA-directed RNA polymerase specialized sigma24 family protein